MRRTALLAATLALVSGPVLAQDLIGVEGYYMGHGEGELTAEITHIENDRYAISINTLVPMENDIPGCGGGIDGEVLLESSGGNFFAENEFYDPEGDTPSSQARYCEIGLSFDGQGELKIEERDGCISYHGAACGFTGTLFHDAAGI